MPSTARAVSGSTQASKSSKSSKTTQSTQTTQATRFSTFSLSLGRLTLPRKRAQVSARGNVSKSPRRNDPKVRRANKAALALRELILDPAPAPAPAGLGGGDDDDDDDDGTSARRGDPTTGAMTSPIIAILEPPPSLALSPPQATTPIDERSSFDLHLDSELKRPRRNQSADDTGRHRASETTRHGSTFGAFVQRLSLSRRWPKLDTTNQVESRQQTPTGSTKRRSRAYFRTVSTSKSRSAFSKSRGKSKSKTTVPRLRPKDVERLRTQLLQPKQANLVIASARRLEPPSMDPACRMARVGKGAEPMRAVCLDCIEGQAEQMIKEAKRVEGQRKDHEKRFDLHAKGKFGTLKGMAMGKGKGKGAGAGAGRGTRGEDLILVPPGRLPVLISLLESVEMDENGEDVRREVGKELGLKRARKVRQRVTESVGKSQGRGDDRRVVSEPVTRPLGSTHPHPHPHQQHQEDGGRPFEEDSSTVPRGSEPHSPSENEESLQSTSAHDASHDGAATDRARVDDSPSQGEAYGPSILDDPELLPFPGDSLLPFGLLLPPSAMSLHRPLAGALPTPETLKLGFDALINAESKVYLYEGPSHVGIHPPGDRMSVYTYWWGFELALPPPTLEYLSQCKQMSTSLLNLLGVIVYAVPGGTRELAPFVGVLSRFIEAEWRALKAQDRGKGVVCGATWFIPAALVARPWDFEDSDSQGHMDNGDGSDRDVESNSMIRDSLRRGEEVEVHRSVRDRAADAAEARASNDS